MVSAIPTSKAAVTLFLYIPSKVRTHSAYSPRRYVRTIKGSRQKLQNVNKLKYDFQISSLW